MTGDASKLPKHSGSGNGKYSEKKGIFSEDPKDIIRSHRGDVTGGRQTSNGGRGHGGLSCP